MRRTLHVLITAALASVALAVPTAQAAADDQSATHYYLALGDSLAQGFQFPVPGQPYYPPNGYVPLVRAALAAADPKLRLNNISCGGESTVSMLHGAQPPDVATSCGTATFYHDLYPHGTQVDEAVNFLHAHKGKIRLITLNIGGNDLLPCFPALRPACIQQGMDRIAVNLDQILTQLQAAAAPGVRIVAMTSYNPIACLLPVNPGLAAASQQITLSFNTELLRLYAAHHVEVADVAAAFAVAELAASAQATSAWTWFCSPEHPGNVHPNNAGYRVIADAFLDVIAQVK